ncbi:MAG TPA: T9SS type A sorting domain-containing protein, partial [Chitinophagales bacterium]|nr:T9SS type A sorting domain-containing protein [Chitinophagales bacterium]
VAPASHNSGTHTLTWIVPGLLLSNGITSIEAIFNIPSSTPIGELLNAHVSVGPDDADCNTQNNTVDLPMLVRGPFDPNIKECFPDSVINPGDSMLTYTIHFQNTGNDTTRFIIVRDTLSEYVDPATARTIASSLTFSQFIVSEQGILTWIFDPAALPDSASDPVNSHASITYTIMVDKNLTPGTVVNNRASIYFDYNTPVHTNTASNTVTTLIGIAETKANAAGFRIYPNPASSIVTVSVDESLVGSQLTITDVTGRKVKNLQLQSATQNLSIENFASGVYMLMVSNGKQTTTKRLVVGR